MTGEVLTSGLCVPDRWFHPPCRTRARRCVGSQGQLISNIFFFQKCKGSYACRLPLTPSTMKANHHRTREAAKTLLGTSPADRGWKATSLKPVRQGFYRLQQISWAGGSPCQAPRRSRSCRVSAGAFSRFAIFSPGQGSPCE